MFLRDMTEVDRAVLTYTKGRWTIWTIEVINNHNHTHTHDDDDVAAYFQNTGSPNQRIK